MALIEDDPYRFGRPGYTTNPPTSEYLAAQAMLEAARLIRDIAYQNNNTQEIDPETLALLISTYRALKPAVVHYWGEQGGLFHELEPEAPTAETRRRFGIPFAKKVTP
jgi:hypothetical protein